MTAQILNPPQFGAEVEFIDGDDATVLAAATCARCDTSSRSGASGKSSGSSSSANS